MSKKIIQDTTQNIFTIKKLYDNGLSIPKIAKIFKVGKTSIFRFFDRNGLKTRNRNEAYKLKNLSSSQEKEALELYFKSGLNRKEIASKLNASIYNIKKLIKENVLPGREKFKLNFEKNSIPITCEQEQIILGTLLGDACLYFRKRNNSDQIELSLSHCEEQLGYIKYIANILDVNLSKMIRPENSKGAGNVYYRLSYSNKYELLKIHKLCFVNNKKSITKEWLKKISPLSIACWFMDDGSSCYSNNKATVSVCFATQSFNEKENNLLRELLLKFDIETTLRTNVKSGTGFSIYVRQKSVNKFMDLVEPYIFNIKCMNYKIKRKSIK